MKIPAAQSAARRYFDEGELDYQDGIELDACPYPMDSQAGLNWTAGWESAQHEDEQAGIDEAEDRRLDDPRHGQAADLNKWRY